MKTVVFVGIVLLLFCCSSLGLKQTCETLQYDGKYVASTRVTPKSILMDGDFIIQGLFGISTGTNCTEPRPSSLMWLLAMQFAIDSINQDMTTLPGLKLGYQVHDSCFSVPSVMSRGIEIVSLHRPSSVCRAEYLDCNDIDGGEKRSVKRVTAVIGTGMSVTTIPLASLLGLYWIPHLSFGASSRLLSKKDLYRSFLRTIPSDSNQAQAMLDVMQRFKWSYVFAVGSDDDYGKLGVGALKDQATGRNVCIAQVEYIPSQRENTEAKAITIVDMIEREPRAHVVVLFCYVSHGSLIIREAKRRGIKRLWLTSDAWVADSIPNDIHDALIGSFSFSTKTGPIPGFIEYVKNRVATQYHCNPWLYSLVNNTLKCSPITDTPTGFQCGNGKTNKDAVDAILTTYDGSIATVIDAVKAVAVGAHAALKNSCNVTDMSVCRSQLPIKPQNLTSYIFGARFSSVHNHTIQFNAEGDPVHAHYNVDNFQVISGKAKFITVGNWENLRSPNLVIDESSIVWAPHDDDVPESTCSKECRPGQFVPASTECCWSCQQCPENSVSNVSMADQCQPCGSGFHTDNVRTRCIRTPIVYLTARQPAGISIVAVSALGLAMTLCLILIFYRYRNTPVVLESSPHLLFFSLVCLLLTFCYGPFQVAKPTKVICSARSAYFFFIFCVYASLILIKTNTCAMFLQKAMYRFLGANVFLLQFFGMFVLIFVELALIALWLGISPIPVESNLSSGKHETWLECKLDFTTNRLIVILFPCLLLVLATVISFRERNYDHIYNEPKFTSFASIALCIIVVAFLPTFKYVIGIYRAIVMAFTIDVCGFTYIGCLMIPKLYIALFNKGRNQFQVDAPESSQTYNVHHVASNGSGLPVPENNGKAVNADGALLDQNRDTSNATPSPVIIAAAEHHHGTEEDSAKDLMGVAISTA